MQLPQFLSSLAGKVSDTPAGQVEMMKEELTAQMGALSTSDKPIVKKAHSILTSVWARLLFAFLFPFIANYLMDYLYPNGKKNDSDPYDANRSSDDYEDEYDEDEEDEWDDEEEDYEERGYRAR